MKGFSVDEIADKVNEAGYRTGSKRFGERLFTSDTITAILHNEFYAAYAPNGSRATGVHALAQTEYVSSVSHTA